jgi:ribonucleoside-diphosphate reductase alpha chain
VAPTGTISLLAGTTSGIEPIFALSFSRHVLDGEVLPTVLPCFAEAARREGFASEAVMAEVARTGRCRGLDGVPERWQRVFPVAHDITPRWHIRHQAAFQRHTENAVSKTINFPADATVDQVQGALELAWQMGCKGLTVYRDRSREDQVLRTGE